MNRMICVALAATAFAAPAMAQDTTTAATTFTGPRVGVTAGFAGDKFFNTDAFTYGAEAGYDFAAGGAVIGITADIQDSKDITRELGLSARVGGRVGSNALVYATGGYSNIRAYGIGLDGYTLGGGAELGFGKGYVKLEQRYGNYQYGAHLWQTTLGAGFRF